jgi:hypothetical protein
VLVCELDMGGGQDCGRPAIFKVMAGPGYSSELKAFYACPDHPQDLYDDLVQAGFRVQEPTPL